MGNYLSSPSHPTMQRNRGPTNGPSNPLPTEEGLSRTPPVDTSGDVYISHIPPSNAAMEAQAEAQPVAAEALHGPSTSLEEGDYLPLWSLNPRALFRDRRRLPTDLLSSDRPRRRRRLNAPTAATVADAEAVAETLAVPRTEPSPATLDGSPQPNRPLNLSLLIFRRQPASRPPQSTENLTAEQSAIRVFQALLQSWSRLTSHVGTGATLTPATFTAAATTPEGQQPLASEPSMPQALSSVPPSATIEAPSPSGPVMQMQYTFMIVGNPPQNHLPTAASDDEQTTHQPARPQHAPHRHAIQTATIEEGLHSLVQWIALMLNVDPATIRFENRDAPISSFEDLLALEDWMGRVSRGVPQSLVDDQLKPVHYVACESDALKSCPVCLENFQLNESIRKLPCSHAYHIQCIDLWLTGHCNNCPLCRAVPITVDHLQ